MTIELGLVKDKLMTMVENEIAREEVKDIRTFFGEVEFIKNLKSSRSGKECFDFRMINGNTYRVTVERIPDVESKKKYVF